MGYIVVDASQGITSEIEICLEAMENNHDESKAMQATLMHNQDWMSNMMDKILAFMKTSSIGSKEKKRPYDVKLPYFARSQGVVKQISWKFMLFVVLSPLAL